jgi:hypothetical protein
MPGREPVNSESSADVRFVEHSGLDSDIARGPRRAASDLIHHSNGGFVRLPGKCENRGG